MLPLILTLLFDHLLMVTAALFLALALAFPLAQLLLMVPRLANPVLGLLSVLYTIPSIALLILLLPLFGLNQTTVIVGLVIYSQIILVRNILAGFQAIPAEVLEAAVGMGLNRWQRWRQIQLPLALPIILAGVRVALIASMGIATIGAKFGAGGLGILLFDGIQQNRYDKLMIGSLVISVTALALNYGLQWLEQQLDYRSRL